jgi:hypothetical protein
LLAVLDQGTFFWHMFMALHRVSRGTGASCPATALFSAAYLLVSACLRSSTIARKFAERLH